MKFEIRENEIVMKPESEYDRQILSRINDRGIIDVYYQDKWNQTGDMILKNSVHPWNK